jgi:hypothetical protein
MRAYKISYRLYYKDKLFIVTRVTEHPVESTEHEISVGSFNTIEEALDYISFNEVKVWGTRIL